ncbi:C6 finger domain-containing protein [Jackrogersella minutella]|nr:C6 finger domain-containing protein [Jackrogersella minutella]
MGSGSSLSPPPPSRRPPKLGHKKSMFGCQRCRARRVKCNEAKPVCYNCSRHRLPCNYDRNTCAKKASPKLTATELSPDETETTEPPESRSRRRLETRLMYQYVTETGRSIVADNVTSKYFIHLIPRLSFKSDALLYSMYNLAALNIAKCYGDEELEGGAENVANTYFSMAVREHKKETSQVNKETADVVCLTSCLMRTSALIQLHGRNREPYTPPWQWLALARTSTSTFAEAFEQVGPDPTSAAFQLIKLTSHLHEDGKLPNRGNFERLRYLMDRPRELQAVEYWDSEIQETYERSLKYLSTILDLMDAEGSSAAVLRMVLVFPMFTDERFIELVREGLPRALVILAHHFAMFKDFHDLWWIGNIGVDEVAAIANAVDERWQRFLAWPLQVIQE